MVWIEAHSDLPDHPKVIFCAELLHIDRDLLVGKLVRFWTWAMDYRENGTFLSAEAPMIAEKMRWPKTGKKAVQQLMDALCEAPPGESAGFLEKTDTGYHIHNWDRFAGKLLEKREKDRARKSEKAEEIRRNSKGNSGEFQKNSDGIPTEFQENSERNRNPNRNRNLFERERDRAQAHTREEKTPEPVFSPEAQDALSGLSMLYEQTSGTLMPSGMAQEIRFRLSSGADPELLKEAMRLSIGKNSETAYFTSVLQSWTAKGIKTLKDYEQSTGAGNTGHSLPGNKSETSNIFAQIGAEKRERAGGN